MSRNKIYIFLGIVLVALLIFFFINRQGVEKETITPFEKSASDFSVIAENLEVPWEMVFLPDGRALVTERPGRIRLIDNKVLNSTPVAVIQEVEATGEGGLLGITVHPEFSNNRYVYVYYTYRNNQGGIRNKVARFIFENNSLSFNKDIINEIPGSNFHNGGRIKFGTDRLLYITTGDAQNPSLAQDTSSLAGKILRITDEGNIPDNNPFSNEVFSYGHRNPQGIDFDEKGNLWATEHGPSARDEVNKIEIGENYGWPIITGNQEREGIISPIIQSGSETWAPSGLVFYNNSLYFVGLRGQALFKLNIDGPEPEIAKYFSEEFGRLRTVVLGPDGYFYITTNNKDSRGVPRPGDDKIIRVLPDSLN